jgi:hypothetical protein
MKEAGDRDQRQLVAVPGADTYARILEEAVAELRGQPIRPEHDPEISVDVPVRRAPPQADLSGTSDLAEVDHADPPSPEWRLT